MRENGPCGALEAFFTASFVAIGEHPMNDTLTPEPWQAERARRATRNAAIAALAAFALKNREAFVRFCEDHREDAEELIDWRIGDLAGAYGLDGRDSRAENASTVLGFGVRRPNGGERPLDRLPRSRAEAFEWVWNENAGPGRYEYVRWVDDPIGGMIDLTEMAVDIYPDGQLGFTVLSRDLGFTATAGDIALYIRHRIGESRAALQFTLSGFGGHPDGPDEEEGLVSLSLGHPDDSGYLEFMLEPSGRLDLGENSDSRQLALFRCRLPSIRSIVQFIEIALEAIQERHVLVSFTPLNQELGGCFF
jgi:hypothetical protein